MAPPERRSQQLRFRPGDPTGDRSPRHSGVISRVSSSLKMICVVFATLNEFRSRAEETGLIFC